MSVAVFVSYSSVDSGIAQKISSSLDTAGISHFLDSKNIEYGAEIETSVVEGLANCTHVVVICSPASLKSHWVPFEIGHASAHGKEIVPFLQHPSLDLPSFLSKYKYSSSIDEIVTFLKSRELSCDANNDMPIPSVVDVTWDEIISGIKKFLSESDKGFDLVVGIAKGGLCIAVALSERMPDSLLTAALKRYESDISRPFYVFEEDSHTRSERSRVIDSFSIPSIERGYQRVLIVDDVTTFGNTLEAVTEITRLEIPAAEIDYYLHAADIVRLSASKPDIAKKVNFYTAIDNKRVWLKFPWE